MSDSTTQARRAPLPRLLDGALAVLVALAFLALAIRRITSADLWTSIACGRWIFEHGLPTVDPFSYATPGQPWIEPRWLFMVGVARVFDGLGANALILGKVALLGAALWLVARQRGNGPLWAGCAGVVTTLLLAQNRFLVRPELSTYLFLALTLLCLERYRAGRRTAWLVPLPLVQVLWTNLHTVFLLGPILQWIFVAAEGAAALPALRPLRRAAPALGRRDLARLAGTAALSSLACLVNPYFVRGALFPVELLGELQGQHYFSRVVSELESPFAKAGWNYYFVGYALVLVLAAASFAVRWRRFPIGRLALWAAMLYLSTLAVRNLGLFGFACGAAVAANLGELAAEAGGRAAVRTLSWLVRGATAAFALVVIPFFASDAFYVWSGHPARFGFGVAEGRTPARALAFVRAQGLPRPVVCKLSEGGYAMLEGGEHSVFVDGRLEVYGWQEVDRATRLTTTGEGWDEAVRAYGLGTAVVHHVDSPLWLSFLFQRPDWAPVYYDASHVVFVRVTPSTRAQLARLAIDWRRPPPPGVEPPPEVAPPDWLAGLWPKVPDASSERALGELLLGAGGVAAAEEHFRRAVALDADDIGSRLRLALILRARGDRDGLREQERHLRSGALEAPDLAPLADWIARGLAGAGPSLEDLVRAREAGADDDATLRQLVGRAGQAGRFDLAEEALTTLLGRHPDDAELWTLRGRVAAARGEREAAVEHFEHALALDPGFEPARRDLARLAAPGGK